MKAFGQNNSRGVARIFKGGGCRFFIEKGKAGSERCLRRFMRLFGTGVPGGFRGEAPEDIPFSLHLKAPDCEKIDILNAFFLSEFFKYNDFYGDFYGDTFVATNFLISTSLKKYNHSCKTKRMDNFQSQE